ncbi:unnamed protein product [Blepharisma stoltei]|uniref:Uncharacterized protein n=1 Tax=Blepharisma stoltei TaxID=1481888 RepID=A0AAU9IJ02_9CILI|nr:unnamed protein product [Blepharisma stoltei]
MQERFAIILLWLGFSIQSLASQDHHEIPKYFLRSLAGPNNGIYDPLKISLEVDESSFQNTQSDKAVKEAAATTASIFLDLVLSQPSKEAIKLGEKIQCDDFLIRQIVKSQGINADFAWHITYSNKSEKEMATIKKCENGSQLLAVSIAINLEKFLKLETVSQVKFLSSALANIIFEDDLIRNQLLSEIEDYLQHLTEYSASECITNCFSCLSDTICSICDTNYYLNANGTQCCLVKSCGTCTNPNQCDSCPNRYYLSNNGQCLPCLDQNCAQCTSTACTECYSEFYVTGNEYCNQCPQGCALCEASAPKYNPVCSQCWDPENSHMVNGLCSCIKPNQVYSIDWGDKCVCNTGFYQDSNGNCQTCGLGCMFCSSVSRCQTCYDFNNMAINSDGTCSCTNSFLHFDTTTNTCSCPNSQYLNERTNFCEPCQIGCASCYSQANCYECVNNNILTIQGGYCVCLDNTKVYDNTTSSCVPCPTGQYAQEGECMPCQSGCTCSGSNECEACLPGLHLSANSDNCVCDEAFTIFNPTKGSCASCDPSQPACDNNCILGCEVCSDYQTCKKCFGDEELVNGVCICKDHTKTFNPTKKGCTGVSSAKGLALVWILTLYVAI